VDFPARLPNAGSPQWRPAALVVGAIAAVELFLLIAAAVMLFGKPFADGVQKAAATSVAEAAKQAAPGRHDGKKHAVAKLPGQKIPAPQLTRHQTSVLILNGNGRSGAADEAAGVIRGLSYLVAGTGNAPRMDFRRSLVMYRPGYKGEAYRLSKDVRVRRVSPLDGMKPSQLGGAHVVLVVGG
jgi:hypothetical protein